MACAAVTTTLAQLDSADYPQLIARGDALRGALENIFKGHGITVTTSGYGNVFGIWHGPVAPNTYQQAAQLANPAFSKDLHLALREAGVLIMPSPYGRLYLSFEHDDRVIEEIKTAFDQAALKLSAAYRA